jgi:hypothetical protein
VEENCQLIMILLHSLFLVVVVVAVVDVVDDVVGRFQLRHDRVLRQKIEHLLWKNRVEV